MKVKALYNNCKEIAIAFDISQLGFSKESKLRITKNLIYEVYALSLFESNIFFQIIDDLQYPSWVPARFFDLIDGCIPDDWICNITRSEPHLIMGPRFIAANIKSYNNMVELAPDEVESFWSRVRELQLSNRK